MAGGRRGRPPKPTQLKILEGNPGKRKLNEHEPKPKIKIPQCPDFLSDEAKQEWQRITPLLLKLKLITEIDRTALAMYCQTYGRWRQAEEKIKADGLMKNSPNGYPIQNPYIAISNKAIDKMRGLLSEFGMSPATRSRVKAEETTDDPVEEFLRRGRKK